MVGHACCCCRGIARGLQSLPMAHTRRRQSGRLRRRARIETVLAHCFGSLSCNASAGKPQWAASQQPQKRRAQHVALVPSVTAAAGQLALRHPALEHAGGEDFSQEDQLPARRGRGSLVPAQLRAPAACRPPAARPAPHQPRGAPPAACVLLHRLGECAKSSQRPAGTGVPAHRGGGSAGFRIVRPEHSVDRCGRARLEPPSRERRGLGPRPAVRDPADRRRTAQRLVLHPGPPPAAGR